MLEPRAGLALVRSPLFWPGAGLGAVVWAVHLARSARVPRFGDGFEAGTALAAVAIVDDSAPTLARVQALYARTQSRGTTVRRAPQVLRSRSDLSAAGSTSVKIAPPPGWLAAEMSPPCRSTIARTIDSPRPLPERTVVPALEASAL